mmetsp:Transcript_8920/g.39266  ORF Transcript_8920/g.39266 Transcript_8920/m.39266 type:complete len:320 (-) Transcript_8920:152-1111(-)
MRFEAARLARYPPARQSRARALRARARRRGADDGEYLGHPLLLRAQARRPAGRLRIVPQQTRREDQGALRGAEGNVARLYAGADPRCDPIRGDRAVPPRHHRARGAHERGEHGRRFAPRRETDALGPRALPGLPRARALFSVLPRGVGPGAADLRPALRHPGAHRPQAQAFGSQRGRFGDESGGGRGAVERVSRCVLRVRLAGAGCPTTARVRHAERVDRVRVRAPRRARGADRETQPAAGAGRLLRVQGAGGGGGVFGVVGVGAAVAGGADEGGRGAVRGGRRGDHALLQHGTGRVQEQVLERAGLCVWERGSRPAVH